MIFSLVGFGILSLVSTSSAIDGCYPHRDRLPFGRPPWENPKPEVKSCAEVKAELEASGEDGDIPRCLENGHYDLFQCKGDECFCTDCSGEPIKFYEKFARGEHGEFQCKCAREADKHKFEFGRSYRCDPKGGHYMPYQCEGRGCYCTDQAGKQIRTEGGYILFKRLTSFTDEYCNWLVKRFSKTKVLKHVLGSQSPFPNLAG